jgi:hypothetical protein
VNTGLNLEEMLVSLFFNATLNDEIYIIIKAEMKSKTPEPKSALFYSFLKTRMKFDLIRFHPIQTPRRRIANLKDYLKSSLSSGRFEKVQKIYLRKIF